MIDLMNAPVSEFIRMWARTGLHPAARVVWPGEKGSGCCAAGVAFVTNMDRKTEPHGKELTGGQWVEWDRLNTKAVGFGLGFDHAFMGFDHDLRYTHLVGYGHGHQVGRQVAEWYRKRRKNPLWVAKMWLMRKWWSFRHRGP